MKKEHVVIWVTVFLLVGIWIGGNFTRNLKSTGSKLEEFFNYLELEYVDTLDIEGLTEQAIDDILSSLDPHSTYIPLDDGAEIAERMQGGFTGIGVEFMIYRDTLVFLHVIENGPASNYGIENGDRIFAIDGDTLIGPLLNNQEITSRIKGPRKSYVDLSIKRGDSLLTVSVQRDLIPIQSVYSLPVHNGIGYVKVDRFSETTHDEFISKLKDLDQRGMRSVIIDLRDNPGGYLHESVEMADEFLKEGQNIVTTRYRDGRTSTSKATSGHLFEDLPVHIIINEASASASEVFTGALQDHDRAAVYGNTSFGKGLVQEDKMLSDGSKVRMTVAYYYTPSGRSIQKPYKENEVANEGVFLSDTGRVLSISGGIEPDVVLSKDSISYFWTFSFGTMDAFAFDYIDRNRAAYNAMLWENFSIQFKVDRSIIADFLVFGGYGIAVEDISQGDLNELESLLKIALAKNQWGFDAYRSLLLKRDGALLQVYDFAARKLQ